MRTLLLCTLIIVLLSACAVADLPPLTQRPPLTLQPVPTLSFAGDCELTDDLSDWSQDAYFLTSDFRAVMDAAASKNRSEIHDDVLRMAQIRNSASAVFTPDCAVEAQQFLVQAMDNATGLFQAFANGDAETLDGLEGVRLQFDQAVALQDELVVRLSTQLRQEADARRAAGTNIPLLYGTSTPEAP